MAAIAGISGAGRGELVGRMLAKMAHRGRSWQKIVDAGEYTLGRNGANMQAPAGDELGWHGLARDGTGSCRFAEARAEPSGVTLRRDALGIAPL